MLMHEGGEINTIPDIWGRARGQKGKVFERKRTGRFQAMTSMQAVQGEMQKADGQAMTLPIVLAIVLSRVAI